MPALVVLVTGASEGGLGYALCQEFAKRGSKVYAGVRRPKSAEGLKPLGVSIVELDVTNSKSRQDAVDLVLSKEGRLDILVNNAGMGYIRALADTDPSDLQRLFDTNLFAPILLSQLAIPPMVQQRSVVIVNISSIVAHTWMPLMGAYAATKAALTNISNTLRLEVEPLGIKVMHVALGGVKTHMPGAATAGMEQWPADSLYGPVKDIVSKAMGDINGITADAAAHSIVSAALKRTPPRELWTATNASFTWLTTYLPMWLVDALLNAMFKVSSWKLQLPAPVQLQQ